MHIESQVKVAAVMTAEVLTIAPETPFKVIVQKLFERHISALLVVDTEGLVVGVVSDADLLLKEDRSDLELRSGLIEPRRRKAERAKSRGETAADLMTSPAVTVSPTAPLAEAARIMHDRQVKRLVVVDEAGNLAGIVTRGDVLRVFLRPDEEIKRTVVEDLVERLLWLESNGLEVAVKEGVVTLGGKLDRRSDVALLAHVAADVDGVVSVVNRLTYYWDDSKASHAPPPVPAYWPGRARFG